MQHGKFTMSKNIFQGMKNNVKFTFSVGDTKWWVYNLILSKTNIVGGIKYNI